jgi:hypothetical protein
MQSMSELSMTGQNFAPSLLIVGFYCRLTGCSTGRLRRRLAASSLGVDT